MAESNFAFSEWEINMNNLLSPIGLMRFIFIILVITGNLSASDWEITAAGKIAIFPMENAPYPDTSRANGYQRQDEFYPPNIHYSDPSVAVFVPADFKSGDGVNLLFYFHGHGNNLRKSFAKFSLQEMVATSGKNVILVFPQGPRDARDSGCGKLEAEGGFSRLVQEVLDTLLMEGIISNRQIGNIVITGHSGAYKVIGRILFHGGLTDKISEVYLLDASYGQLEVFADWVTKNPDVRFRSIFTDHLAPENTELMEALDKQGVVYQLVTNETASSSDFTQRVLFVHATSLDHGQTVQWLELFLSTGSVAAY